MIDILGKQDAPVMILALFESRGMTDKSVAYACTRGMAIQAQLNSSDDPSIIMDQLPSIGWFSLAVSMVLDTEIYYRLETRAYLYSMVEHYLLYGDYSPQQASSIGRRTKVNGLSNWEYSIAA